MISENVSRYENVVVRNHKEIGINDYGLDYLVKIEQELERYKNIIDGMEKFFQYAYDNEVRPLNDRKVSVWTICLDKLKELKGSDD